MTFHFWWWHFIFDDDISRFQKWNKSYKHVKEDPPKWQEPKKYQHNLQTRPVHHCLIAFMSKETIKRTVLMSKETYTNEKNQQISRQLYTRGTCTTACSLSCQKRPTYMSKEANKNGKNPTNINTTLQKRHVHHYQFTFMSKETYIHVKRGQYLYQVLMKQCNALYHTATHFSLSVILVEHSKHTLT